MKIEKNGNVLTAQVSKLSLSKSGAEPAAQETSGTADRVELSGWKNEVANLKEQTTSAPAVDEDKVASIKGAIDSGTYAADGKMVARSMLRSQLLDELV